MVYWKCEVGRELEESLPIPAHNPGRDQALVSAAQQHMADSEVARRKATGTLDSASLMAKAIQMLAATPEASLRYTKVSHLFS